MDLEVKDHTENLRKNEVEREQGARRHSDHNEVWTLGEERRGASDRRHPEDLLASPAGRPSGQTLVCAVGLRQECPITTVLPALS